MRISAYVTYIFGVIISNTIDYFESINTKKNNTNVAAVSNLI